MRCTCPWLRADKATPCLPVSRHVSSSAVRGLVGATFPTVRSLLLLISLLDNGAGAEHGAAALFPSGRVAATCLSEKEPVRGVSRTRCCWRRSDASGFTSAGRRVLPRSLNRKHRNSHQSLEPQSPCAVDAERGNLECGSFL